MKPTAISASSVLTPMMIVLVRAWSVIVSRTSCQSVKPAPRSAGATDWMKALDASGSASRTPTRVPVPVAPPIRCTVLGVAQVSPGSQCG